MAEHEQLRLGVDAGSLGRRGQPGIADLGGIGDRRGGIAERDSRHGGPHERPLPVVQFQEPGRTDDPPVGGSDHRERERSTRRLIGEGTVDVLVGRLHPHGVRE
ncbi:hypothetical protein GCM10020254_13340 [Streptomyces goshikiensis]